MLMSFGPGVFFLFVARARRLKPPAGGKDATHLVARHGQQTVPKL
jgi:hypothetical protein